MTSEQRGLVRIAHRYDVRSPATRHRLVGTATRQAYRALTLSRDVLSLGRGRSQHGPQIFCLNSGNCGSSYLVSLFQANGIDECFHEKFPALDAPGTAYWLTERFGLPLRLVLKLTRNRVNLESSNRLFALALVLHEVFPDARFIHLHRDPRVVTNSLVNKNIWPQVMHSNRLRVRSRLSGDRGLPEFERACWYWRNINTRIADDLDVLAAAGVATMELRFDDLVGGEVTQLAAFVERDLRVGAIDPVNTKDWMAPDSQTYDSWEEWPPGLLERFDAVCGDAMRRFGYG